MPGGAPENPPYNTLKPLQAKAREKTNGSVHCPYDALALLRGWSHPRAATRPRERDNLTAAEGGTGLWEHGAVQACRDVCHFDSGAGGAHHAIEDVGERRICVLPRLGGKRRVRKKHVAKWNAKGCMLEHPSHGKFHPGHGMPRAARLCGGQRQ